MKYWISLAVLIAIICILAGCSGDSDDDAPIISEEDVTWSAVSAGKEYVLALRSDGTLWAWGFNEKGQLGLGQPGHDDRATRMAPVRVGSDTGWKLASAGESHSIAIDQYDRIIAWGLNDEGQLGDGTYDEYSYPILSIGQGRFSQWVQANAGGRHNLFIKNDGSLWADGDDQHYQLGDGDDDNLANNSTLIIPIASDLGWIAADGGYSHSAGIKTDHTLWTWGWNDHGQLGIDNIGIFARDAPTRVGDADDWSQVSAGGFHTVALKSDGSLWAWGWNDCGQLGDGTNETRGGPVKIGSDTDWIAVSAGMYHTLALKSDNSLWAWGKNEYGQLGDGTNENRNAPVPIGTVDDTWTAISAGGEFSVAIKTGGSLWTWGDNRYGQLGNGTRGAGTGSNVPVFISE